MRMHRGNGWFISIQRASKKNLSNCSLYKWVPLSLYWSWNVISILFSTPANPILAEWIMWLGWFTPPGGEEEVLSSFRKVSDSSSSLGGVTLSLLWVWSLNLAIWTLPHWVSLFSLLGAEQVPGWETVSSIPRILFSVVVHNEAQSFQQGN